ncbi:unnamed protein product [Protopolystoma xenopodis]|uniref:Uncharacterized protein n=1 Tax=Protopolystoma xenopodis TaxID=117903 RepID=A0A448WVZ9_9PLAT|nr:unnamed protein product [Protopolystoma xenopodis]
MAVLASSQGGTTLRDIRKEDDTQVIQCPIFFRFSLNSLRLLPPRSLWHSWLVNGGRLESAIAAVRLGDGPGDISPNWDRKQEKWCSVDSSPRAQVVRPGDS